MAESGIDISRQNAKDIDALGDLEFDYVVTRCDNAKESCPFFPAKTPVMRRGFDDPPKLAGNTNNDEAAMDHYRRVRDEIKAFIETLPNALIGEQRAR